MKFSSNQTAAGTGRLKKKSGQGLIYVQSKRETIWEAITKDLQHTGSRDQNRGKERGRVGREDRRLSFIPLFFGVGGGRGWKWKGGGV